MAITDDEKQATVSLKGRGQEHEYQEVAVIRGHTWSLSTTKIHRPLHHLYIPENMILLHYFDDMPRTNEWADTYFTLVKYLL